MKITPFSLVRVPLRDNLLTRIGRAWEFSAIQLLVIALFICELIYILITYPLSTLEGCIVLLMPFVFISFGLYLVKFRMRCPSCKKPLFDDSKSNFDPVTDLSCPLCGFAPERRI